MLNRKCYMGNYIFSPYQPLYYNFDIEIIRLFITNHEKGYYTNLHEINNFIKNINEKISYRGLYVHNSLIIKFGNTIELLKGYDKLLFLIAKNKILYG